MMNSIGVPPSSAEAGAFALLVVLADPAATKQRLDELAARESAARQAEQDANAAIKSAEAATADHEARRAELEVRERAVSDREAAVSRREATWEGTKAAIKAELATAQVGE
jgi:hypothetical protein